MAKGGVKYGKEKSPGYKIFKKLLKKNTNQPQKLSTIPSRFICVYSPTSAFPVNTLL